MRPRSSTGAVAPSAPPQPASNHRDRSRTKVSESETPAIAGPTPARHRPRTNQDWWPNQPDLAALHEHAPQASPLEPDFNYAEASRDLDGEALKRDIVELLTTSQDWWPADWGHYGPMIVRMTWHAAGTYRIA